MIIRTVSIILSTVLVLAGSSLLYAAEPASSEQDTLRVADTTAQSTSDSLLPTLVPPAPPTSVPKQPRFAPFDTLVSYFISPRLNQSENLARSYFYDAGDYFKFDPSFVAMEYLITPMRKTVKPYGLTGNHLGVLSNDLRLRPFDHPIEPDGLVDFNDIPTATDNDVFLLPGALGTVFGSRHDVATLLMRPIRPSPREAQSAFIVDKGSYGLSYARSRYSRGFSNGRAIDMGIAYRLGDYYGANSDDDSYAYDGDFSLPVGERLSVKATGHLYQRNGILTIASPGSLSVTNRDRFDRTARVLLASHGANGKSITSFGYTYLRQGSNLGPNLSGALYKGRFGVTDHGVVGSRQWLAGGSIVSLFATAVRNEYDNGWDNYTRHSGDALFGWARVQSVNVLAFTAGARSAEQYGLLPNASLVWKRETNRSLLLVTAGYSEREPSLHELYLPKRFAVVYGGTAQDYEEFGNADLKRERQLVGSLRAEFGAVGSSAALSVVGGKFWDGIDWRSHFDTAFSTRVFSPANDDITFVTTTVSQDIHLGQFLSFHGGASYHYLDYASDRAKTYQPEYQAFGGAELHVFWKQKLIHLYAYGEGVYLGPYDGYRESDLGQTVVFNGKVSFSMGKFRFHLVMENLLSKVYESREFGVMPGRTMFWGFVWNFLD